MPIVSSNTKNNFEVDLTNIEGDGDFHCPKCGLVISPNDLTTKVYTILSIEGKDDNPTSMVIQCNKCKSIINLNGFDV